MGKRHTIRKLTTDMPLDAWPYPVMSTSLDPIFTAAFLTERSKEILRDILDPTYEDVLCHHMTLGYGKPHAKACLSTKDYGKHVIIGIQGIRIGAGIEALEVHTEGLHNYTFAHDIAFAHITFSRKKGVKAFTANRLEEDDETVEITRFEYPILVEAVLGGAQEIEGKLRTVYMVW